MEPTSNPVGHVDQVCYGHCPFTLMYHAQDMVLFRESNLIFFFSRLYFTTSLKVHQRGEVSEANELQSWRQYCNLVSLSLPLVLLMFFQCVCPVYYNTSKICLRESRSIGETQGHNLTPQMMHVYVLYHHNTINCA